MEFTMRYFTPVENLLRNSADYGDKVFLHQPISGQWHEFTWAKVEHQARCIATGLQAQGYEQGTKIGILSKNCAHWLIADLAIMIRARTYTLKKQSTLLFLHSRYLEQL
jgi:long-chain acyl-CoA synthetase